MFIETYIALLGLVVLLPIALTMHGNRAYQDKRRAQRLAQRREQ